ncbi:MotA/TolQ/ExbB proton channel family protein [candidate division KSB1 bacterium]|nr:MotA/TolQ/ExbB proton channel family protein [candidate division KSB1 bacterium]
MFRYRATSLVLIVTLLLLVLAAGLAFGFQQDSTSAPAQQQPLDTMPQTSGMAGQTATPAEAPKNGMATNFSQVTDQGGPVMYPIYGVFIVGLGVVIFQFVRIFFDRRYAKPIKTTIEKMMVDEGGHTEEKIARIAQLTDQYGKSNLARLLGKLCDLWQRDPSAEALQVEIDGYVSSVKERYEIGRNFAILLSDTAGALGLLGTVLGMYITFMPGQLESSQIISGMGVALVTTISGLVVSIILNFAISWAHSTFHSHLESVTEFADEFRNRFGRGQAHAAGATIKEVRVIEKAALPGTPSEIGVAAFADGVDAEKVKRPHREPAKIRILGGDKQVADAGAPLPKPLEIAVTDQYGDPMKNLTVMFETNGSLVTFDNNDAVKRVDTDIDGRAKVHARLGKLIGKYTIVARVNGKVNLSEQFEVESRPGAPEKVHVLSGHLQMAQAGVPLPEPLSLKLEDACGNPVPDQPVVFEVTYNSGRLERGKSRVEVHTDDEGIASVGFRLGETPGANIVKAISKSKGGRRLEVSFESMGKE